jgi:hypothetical protein
MGDDLRDDLRRVADEHPEAWQVMVNKRPWERLTWREEWVCYRATTTRGQRTMDAGIVALLLLVIALHAACLVVTLMHWWPE